VWKDLIILDINPEFYGFLQEFFDMLGGENEKT